jgi:hypothetical protein
MATAAVEKEAWVAFLVGWVAGEAVALEAGFLEASWEAAARGAAVAEAAAGMEGGEGWAEDLVGSAGRVEEVANWVRR